MIDPLRSASKCPSSRIGEPARYDYPAVSSIRFFAVSDDAEESERAAVAAAGGASVLLVLPERIVLL